VWNEITDGAIAPCFASHFQKVWLFAEKKVFFFIYAPFPIVSEEPLPGREWRDFIQKNLFFYFIPLPIWSDFIRGTGVPHFVPHFQKVWLFAPIPYGDKLYATLEPKKQAKLS